MTARPLSESAGGGRFPGFDVMGQATHWDAATAAVVEARLLAPPPIRFFTAAEEGIARALFDQLLDQREEPRVPIVNMVDARLVDGETDGWHYEGMPIDSQSWQQSLAGLTADCEAQFAVPFPEAGRESQRAVLRGIQNHDSSPWHGLDAGHVWNLWMRYACTAFYSHPWAWEEIGFAGPSYPRGYKNLGVDRREPFEVADAHPGLDPAREDRS